MLKVSIITVAYNSIKTIEQTIRSVLSQGYSDIEYIIIDGGSSDGTQDIIKKYEESIAYWISESDNGIYDAMNKGLKRATGDIIGIINSDDWYEEGIIEKVVHCFETKPVEVTYGSIVNVYENGEKKIWTERPIETLCFQMAVPHPSVFVKKSVYMQYGLFDLQYKLTADYELLLRFYNNNVKFYNMHMVIAYFRVGGASEIGMDLSFQEAYEISLKYAVRYNNLSQIRSMIQEKYKPHIFIGAIRNSISLKQMISNVLNKEIEKIMIFGAGDYGKICFEALQRDGVKVPAFIDNDKSKWGKQLLGIPICSPECLEHNEVTVIVANEIYTADIICQLWAMNNEKLTYVSLRYLRDYVFEFQ